MPADADRVTARASSACVREDPALCLCGLYSYKQADFQVSARGSGLAIPTGMTESIRRQLVVPPYVSAIHMAAGLGLVTAGIMLVAASRGVPVTGDAPRVELSVEAPVEAPREAVAAIEAAAPLADEIKLVFGAGGASYMRLASLEHDGDGERALPRHGAPRLVKDGAAAVAIAAVADADVPALLRAWAGKQVVVDGACRATVTGFAVVSRLAGDPSYAGLAKDEWDTASVMHSGALVLAARLDRCSGTYARDAALAPVAVPREVRGEKGSERLVRTARSALIASAASATAKQSWETTKPEGAEGAWWEHATVSTQVLRHPRTQQTFVSVHIHADEGCGGPDINVWGLYRAGADGKISPVRELRMEQLHSIDHMIDVEGDGELELIGRTWLGDGIVLVNEDGTERDRLDMQFYGCAC